MLSHLLSSVSNIPLASAVLIDFLNPCKAFGLYQLKPVFIRVGLEKLWTNILQRPFLETELFLPHGGGSLVVSEGFQAGSDFCIYKSGDADPEPSVTKGGMMGNAQGAERGRRRDQEHLETWVGPILLLRRVRGHWRMRRAEQTIHCR